MTNNTTAVSVVTPETMPAITHAGRPVVTTALLAKLYGTEAAYITKNHHRNQDRFVDGKHFHKLEGADLKAFKHSMSSRHSVEIPRQTRSLILWTERGAARHAKMLDTDQAWDVFEKLEDCYFAKAEQSAPQLQHVGLTPAQQRHVQNRVAELAGRDRTKFATIYRSIKDRFMVGSYKDVPESEYPALCMMLMCDPMEGEWLQKPEKDGVFMCGDDLYRVWFLARHFDHIYRIFREHDMYRSLTALGSRAGIEMIDHFKDGSMASFMLLKTYGDEMDAYQRRNRMNQYHGMGVAA